MANSLFSIESHSKGPTCITYDDKLDYVITGGTDGIVKIWSGFSNTMVLTYHLSSGINCIVSENERVFSASGSNRIEIHSIINKNKTTVLSQFSSSVNYLQIDETKNLLVACSDDFSVKLINLASDKNREINFEGHEGPVMSVAINSAYNFIASSSCDGCVKVWDIDKKIVLKSLQLLNKSKDISQAKNLCRIKWNPNDFNNLLVPLDDEIQIIDISNWEKCGAYKWSDVSNCNITECAFNADGRFLAAGTTDGWVIVWNTVTKDLVTSWRSFRTASITGLLWQPKREWCLLFADSSGFWEAIEIDEAKLRLANDILNQEELDSMFDDLNDDYFKDEDEKTDPASIRPDNSPVKPLAIEAMIDDMAVDLDDGEEEPYTADRKEDAVSISSTIVRDDFDEDEDAGESGEDEISLSRLKAQFESPVKSAAESRVVTTKIVHVKREPHPPIISTHCPRNGNQQLLLWNSVAALKNHYEESSGFLEVDFQDCEVHRNLIYRHDPIEYRMGDANRYALLLVSNTDDEMEEDIRQDAWVHVRPLNAQWKEWNLSLPTNEQPIGCCLVGQDYAVILTNRFLRYFHMPTAGFQVHIESLHGTAVAIASSTYALPNGNHRMIIVMDNGNQLVWRIEELRPGSWMENGKLVGAMATDWYPLPLSDSATLTWIGFSDGSNAFSVDSKHCVRRLHLEHDEMSKQILSQPRWVPVLDFRHAMDKEMRNTDRYFPIGFLEQAEPKGAMVVHCVNARFPKVVPWPHLTMVPFRLPLCHPQNEVTQLEESFVFHQLLPDWSTDSGDLELENKKLLMKLFANALLQDQDSRGFAIAKLMPDSHVIQLAIRYAVANKKYGLAERMGELALEKDEEMKIMKNTRKPLQSAEDNGQDCEKENCFSEAESAPNAAEERGLKKSIADDLVKDLLREDSLVKSPEPNEPMNLEVHQSPFQVTKDTPPLKRGGIFVIDKLGQNIPKKTTPKKSSIQFGNFTPKPSEQTFKIKRKRQSIKPENSPLAKALKK